MARKRVLNPQVSRPADDEAHGRHSVYRIYGHDGVLLYIGVAREVTSRIYMHETAWYSSVASMAISNYGGIGSWTRQEYPTKVAAREAERKAITAEAPLFNRQHNPKRFRRQNGAYVRVDGLTDADLTRVAWAPRGDALLRERTEAVAS